MLTWILIVVVLLWVMGVFTLTTKLIHLLLIIAVILLLLRIIKGR
jgi:hypothetical protein